MDAGERPSRLRPSAALPERRFEEVTYEECCARMEAARLLAKPAELALVALARRITPARLRLSCMEILADTKQSYDMEHAKYRQQQQKMAQRSRLYGSNADDGIDDDDDGNGRGIGSVRKPTDMAASWAPDVGRSTKRLRQHVSQASPQIGVDVDDRQRAIIENSRAVPSPAPPPPIPLPGDEESDEEGNDGNAMDVDDPLVNL